jgi:hypothetical protein
MLEALAKAFIAAVRAYMTGCLFFIQLGCNLFNGLTNFNIILGVVGVAMWVALFIIGIKWGFIKALWVLIAYMIVWSVTMLVVGATQKEKVAGNNFKEMGFNYIIKMCSNK